MRLDLVTTDFQIWKCHWAHEVREGAPAPEPRDTKGGYIDPMGHAIQRGVDYVDHKDVGERQPRQPLADSEKTRQRRLARRRRGECWYCPSLAEPGHSMCARHLKALRHRSGVVV